MPKPVVAVLLAVSVFAVLSLACGAPYLEALLPGGLPFGNALTALGLCSAAGAAVGLSARGTALRIASLAALGAAAFWLPVSVALAGNLALNLGSVRGQVWIAFSVAIAAGVFGVLVWVLVATLIALWGRTGAA
jgi:hypothetical protein